jgi:hypothetical protein
MSLLDIRQQEIERESLENKLKLAKIDLKIAEFKYHMSWPTLISDIVRTLAELGIAVILILWGLGRL